jgi:translation initiation factor IF-3
LIESIRKAISNGHHINNQIRAAELVVIDEAGKSHGVLTREAALALAAGRGLDLVEVNPAARPPVARLMDYGKFAYQEQKNLRKQRAKAGTKGQQELKNIRIKFKTSLHDLETKARQAQKFLEKGHRLRVEIFLRGREKAHFDLAKVRLEEFLKMLGQDHRTIEEMRKVPSGYVTTISH